MPLVERVDQLGRVTFTCPGCTRREAGLCQGCPSPVDGELGKAKWCKACRVLAHRRHHQKYRTRDLAKYNESAAFRMRRNRAKAKAQQPRKSWQSIVERRTATRCARLSPEQRKAIAKKANQTRWQKYYQRQMLAKMREQSTNLTLSSEASLNA